MDLDNLKERTTFLYGDMDMPTPGKLCLIKFTDKYLERSNRKFDTKYIVGELRLINKKPFVSLQFVKYPNQCYNINKEVTCSWSNNIVEKWYYMNDIEAKLGEIK